MDILETLALATVLWFLQAKEKALFNLCGPDADLIMNKLAFCSFAFRQEVKQRADSFSSIVTGVKSGCSVYINIQEFAHFQWKYVLPLIVYFFSACLTGNDPLTAVLLLILGARALAKKPLSKQMFLFFILLGLVFLLEIQGVEGRHLKADVIAPPPPLSFKGMFSEEKKVNPPAPPCPSAAPVIHN